MFRPPPPPPFDVREPFWKEARPGMGGVRIRHRVVLVRHGESDANLRLMTEGMAGAAAAEQEPSLTRVGASQARDVASHLALLSNLQGGVFTKIESSPMRRAWQTAMPSIVECRPKVALVKYDLRERQSRKPTYEVAAVEEQSEYPSDVPYVDGGDESTWLYPHETAEEFAARVTAVTDRWRGEGTVTSRFHTLVFTHSLFINQILGQPNLFFHLSNGSITVLDYDEHGDAHVHFVNSVEHLDQTSGHHTAHQTTSSLKTVMCYSG